MATFYPLGTEIYAEMWFCKGHWKVKVIRQNKWHQQLPWPQKHRLRHQNLHPKCFSSKVIVKDIFLHNGGQRNAFAYVTCSNRPRYFFHLLKGLNPSYLVLKFGNILPITNWDMAQNVISQRKGQGHRSKQMAPSDSLTLKTYI